MLCIAHTWNCPLLPTNNNPRNYSHLFLPQKSSPKTPRGLGIHRPSLQNSAESESTILPHLWDSLQCKHTCTLLLDCHLLESHDREHVCEAAGDWGGPQGKVGCLFGQQTEVYCFRGKEPFCSPSCHLLSHYYGFARQFLRPKMCLIAITKRKSGERVLL